MSIIYEALKKVKKEESAVNSQASKVNKTRLAIYGLVVLIVSVAWLSYKVFFEKTKTAKIIVRARKISLRKKYLLAGAKDTKGILLNGILYDKDNPVAIINNVPLKVGESLGDIKVLKIEETKVVIITPEGQKTLELNR